MVYAFYYSYDKNPDATDKGVLPVTLPVFSIVHLPVDSGVAMMRIYLWVPVVLIMCVSCAQVPQEAVQLSSQVGKDLAATRTAHTALVRQYFAGMRGNINAFVDQTYRPFILRTTMEDLDLVANIEKAAAGQHELQLDPLDIMEIYVEEAINQIETFRSEMLTPVNRQESDLLAELDTVYTAMINANATVTAHLRSITKVHEAQQDVLNELGVAEDLRKKISGQAASLSGQLNDVLREARSAEDKLDTLPGKVSEIMGKASVSK